MNTYDRSAQAGPISSIKGTVAVDAASIAAATTGATTVSFQGAQTGDVVSASPRTALTVGLVLSHVRVQAAGILSFLFGNVTTAAVDGTAVTFDIDLQRN